MLTGGKSFVRLCCAGYRTYSQALSHYCLAGELFACCVSALGRYVPHYRTWCSNNSSVQTMLTLSLVWTPDRHRQLTSSCPELKPIESLASK